ncbi:MAG: hypothetical protein HY053_08750 [Proteobacteria bacterium]|nr:hypothetical protein [Pseudomonadota bacterium]
MTSADLPHRLEALQSHSILVVGDLMLDRFIYGQVERISPEAPIPVLRFQRETAMLGGAGNVAANLAALGGRVVPFGVVGEDEAAAALRRCLAALDLPEKGILADAGRTTTVKTRIIARHQQVVRVDCEKRAPLGKALEERLIRRIKAAGPELLARFGCSAAVITLGEKGMSIFEEGTHGQFHIPATSFEVSYARMGLPGISREATGRQVFDVTGAGDTVLATLALAASAGASLRAAAVLANAAAGVVVGKLGTATVSPAELLAAVSELT